MNARAVSAVVVATLAGALVGACGPKRVTTAPPQTAETLVVLLPDSETRTVGRARLSNAAGSTELTAARDSSVAAPGRRPTPATTIGNGDVQRVFGAALAALPPAARHFTLYFRFESNELTDESRALLPEILKVVRQRTLPEILVVGHTDTMGAARANLDLGLKRATTVRNLLVQTGLDPSTVEVTSHGESNLLIHTPDGTAEPRNRRVEISVR